MKKNIIFFLVFIIYSNPFSIAQEVDHKSISNEVYTEVFSPFCPGRSLKDCPSSKAENLKKEIYQKIKSGQTKQEVLKDIFRVYGDKYRALPAASGFSLLAWLLPIIFLLIGALVFYFVFLKNKTCIKSKNYEKLKEDNFDEIDKLL